MGKRVLKTKLCEMLGIDYPILSAGMGPTLIVEKTGAPVELLEAVLEAGGLGVLAGQVSGIIKEIKPADQVLADMVAAAVDILTRKLLENVVAK